MPRPIRAYVRYVDAVSDVVGLITMYVVFLMIAVLLLNTITRNVLNMPLSWCMEMAQFILAGYYTAGAAYSMRLQSHVRMDLLYDRLSDRGKATMDVFTSFFLFFYLITLFIGSISSTAYAIKYDQRNFSMWNPSMVPIKVIMVGGIALLLLQALSTFFKDFATMTGKPIR